MKQYDAIIIGFGKGGKLLAAELAERNWKVAIVERSPQMYGGTCVNVGCIPTKALIHESEYAEKRYYDDYKNQSKLYALAVARKDKLVSFLREKNYENVKNKPNITLYDGTASFLSENTIRIVSGKDETILEGKEIFINTGSTPILPAIDGLKESKYVYTSETLLQSNKLPAHLLVIGGGAVGLEFATMYAGFGSHVTLLEALNRKRINVRLNARVQSVYDTAEGITLTYTDSANGTPYYLKGDALLVAIGRKPMTAELNLEKAGIQTDKRGAIVVDNQLRTTAPHVWALGDVKGDEQFDYLSIDDFRIIRNQLFENKKRSTKDRYPIPFAIFTDGTYRTDGRGSDEERLFHTCGTYPCCHDSTCPYATQHRRYAQSYCRHPYRTDSGLYPTLCRCTRSNQYRSINHENGTALPFPAGLHFHPPQHE